MVEEDRSKARSRGADARAVAEHRACADRQGTVTWRVYRDFFANGGSTAFVLITLAFLLLAQIIMVLNDW
jgi:hypothetical protein